MNNKLWSECSAAEKRAVNALHKKYLELVELYKDNKIDTVTFMKTIAIIANKLDELEEKYD